MIDFSDPGDISVFIDEMQIAKLENHMNIKGYLEGHLMASAFNSLRASDLIWAFFIRNYLHGKPPYGCRILCEYIMIGCIIEYNIRVLREIWQQFFRKPLLKEHVIHLTIAIYWEDVFRFDSYGYFATIY